MTTLATPGRETLTSRLRNFFYDEQVPYGPALLRMCLPVALLCDMVPRWFVSRDIYSTDGTPMPLWDSYGTPALFPLFSAGVALAMHTALLFVLVTAMIGWRTRLSLATAFVIYTAFCLLDSVSTETKYTVIASHLLLLLSLSQSGAIWSIDSLLARRRQQAEGFSDEAILASLRSPMWPTRLIQLMIGMVYLGAAYTKIHTPAFFSGDQLYHWLMTDYNSDHPIGHWMSTFPWLIVVSSYVSITWEILFVFLCWKGLGRIVCLAFGASFHMMTLFLLGLYIFPMVCIPIYFAFFSDKEYERLFAALQSRMQKSPRLDGIASSIRAGFAKLSLPGGARAYAYSAPVFFSLLAIVTIGGVALERQLDFYGERRPEGPYALKELDPEYVEGTLLVRSKPMRDADKFSALSLGTYKIGGVVVDNRTDFRQGDKMIAQAILVPPHEDLGVQFGLHDADDRAIDTVGIPVMHDLLRTDCMFTLPASLEPGDYAIVVKCAGNEVLRRKFTLEGSKHALRTAAN